MKVCAFTGHRPKSFPWKYNDHIAGLVQNGMILRLRWGRPFAILSLAGKDSMELQRRIFLLHDPLTRSVSYEGSST